MRAVVVLLLVAFCVAASATTCQTNPIFNSQAITCSGSSYNINVKVLSTLVPQYSIAPTGQLDMLGYEITIFPTTNDVIVGNPTRPSGFVSFTGYTDSSYSVYNQTIAANTINAKSYTVISGVIIPLTPTQCSTPIQGSFNVQLQLQTAPNTFVTLTCPPITPTPSPTVSCLSGSCTPTPLGISYPIYQYLLNMMCVYGTSFTYDTGLVGVNVYGTYSIPGDIKVSHFDLISPQIFITSGPPGFANNVTSAAIMGTASYTTPIAYSYPGTNLNMNVVPNGISCLNTIRYDILDYGGAGIVTRPYMSITVGVDQGVCFYSVPPLTQNYCIIISPPVAAPVAPPVAAPVAPPVAAPVAPPVAAPVAPPVAACKYTTYRYPVMIWNGTEPKVVALATISPRAGGIDITIIGTGFSIIQQETYMSPKLPSCDPDEVKYIVNTTFPATPSYKFSIGCGMYSNGPYCQGVNFLTMRVTVRKCTFNQGVKVCYDYSSMLRDPVSKYCNSPKGLSQIAQVTTVCS